MSTFDTLDLTPQFESIVRTIASRVGLESDEKLQAFTELVLTQVYECVVSSDPSTKMVLRAPYSTVMDNIHAYFYEGILPGTEEPTEDGVIFE